MFLYHEQIKYTFVERGVEEESLEQMVFYFVWKGKCSWNISIRNNQLSTPSVPNLTNGAQSLFLHPKPVSQNPGKSPCFPCRFKNGGFLRRKIKLTGEQSVVSPDFFQHQSYKEYWALSTCTWWVRPHLKWEGQTNTWIKSPQKLNILRNYQFQ